MSLSSTEHFAPNSKKQIAKDLLVCVSLANLVFVRTWLLVLDPSINGYFSESPHTRYDLLALLLLVNAFSAALFFASRIYRCSKSQLIRKPAKLVFCGIAAIALLCIADVIRRKTGLAGLINSKNLPLSAGKLMAIIVAGLGLIAFRNLNPLVKIIYKLFQGGSVAVIILYIQAAVTLAKGNWPVPNLAVINQLADSRVASSRVFWYIFDEAEQRTLFEARPNGLILSNLDWFASHSLMATNAYPPANQTLRSIPSLLLGQVVKDARAYDDSHLTLDLGPEVPSALFPNKSNLVDQLMDQGHRVGVVGWYHPYSRWFGSSTNLAVSFWKATSQFLPFSRTSFISTTLSLLKYNFSPQDFVKRIAVANFKEMLPFVGQIVEDSSVDLAFIHYPIPHWPSIEAEASKKGFPNLPLVASAYFGNAQVMDKLLAQIKRDSDIHKAVIIISSDHWWRDSTAYDGKTDKRIPFIVHFPNDNTQLTYTNFVNTVCTRFLIEDIMAGKVRSNLELRDWLLAYPMPKWIPKTVKEEAGAEPYTEQ